MHDLSVIIPFYNEKQFLFDSVSRVINLGIIDKIILSDDFSDDGSEEIAKNLAEKFKFITYIRSNENQGKGSALNNSKKFINTTHVIIHDADLEYFPADIIDMYEVSKKHPENLILGSRFIGNKIRKTVYLRTFLANKVMSLFFSIVNFYKVSDVATCYKLMPSKFFQEITFNEKGFSIEIELLTKFLKTNNDIKEVPIRYEGRSYLEGKKIKSIDGFRYLLNILKYRFRD